MISVRRSNILDRLRWNVYFSADPVDGMLFLEKEKSNASQEIIDILQSAQYFNGPKRIHQILKELNCEDIFITEDPNNAIGDWNFSFKRNSSGTKTADIAGRIKHLQRNYGEPVKIEHLRKPVDVGAAVIYIPGHAKGDPSHPDSQLGVISSWNDKYVFVNFGKSSNPACDPRDLLWAGNK